jgi:hypothetical protein
MLVSMFHGDHKGQVIQQMFVISLAFWLKFCTILSFSVSNGCFFPPQYQGQFKAQLSSGAGGANVEEPQLAFHVLGPDPSVAGEPSSAVFSIRRQQLPEQFGGNARRPGPRSPQYTKIFILPDGIPEWGRCLERHGDNIIFQNKR